MTDAVRKLSSFETVTRRTACGQTTDTSTAGSFVSCAPALIDTPTGPLGGVGADGPPSRGVADGIGCDGDSHDAAGAQPSVPVPDVGPVSDR